MRRVLPERAHPLFKTLKEFHIHGEIGSGAFSVVYEVTHLPTNTRYSIKEVKLHELDSSSTLNVTKELEIHQKLDHPHIVKLHDFFVEQEVLYMVLTLCPQGNLFKHINTLIKLPEPDVRRIFRQTCEALAYVHAQKVILRDLKPENILLDAARDVKLCDFGWATHVGNSNYNRARAGTYAYMPPEALASEHQTLKSDIWALGVLLFELHHNREPYKAHDIYTQMKAIKETTPVFDSPISSEARELIEACLRKAPAERPDIDQVLQHPFLAAERGRAPEAAGPMRENINPPRLKLRRTSNEKKARPNSIVAFRPEQGPPSQRIPVPAFTPKAPVSYSTDKRSTFREARDLLARAAPAEEAILCLYTPGEPSPAVKASPHPAGRVFAFKEEFPASRSMSVTVSARSPVFPAEKPPPPLREELPPAEDGRAHTTPGGWYNGRVLPSTESRAGEQPPTPKDKGRPSGEQYNIYRQPPKPTEDQPGEESRGRSSSKSVTRFTLVANKVKTLTSAGGFLAEKNASSSSRSIEPVLTRRAGDSSAPAGQRKPLPTPQISSPAVSLYEDNEGRRLTEETPSSKSSLRISETRPGTKDSLPDFSRRGETPKQSTPASQFTAKTSLGTATRRAEPNPPAKASLPTTSGANTPRSVYDARGATGKGVTPSSLSFGNQASRRREPAGTPVSPRMKENSGLLYTFEAIQNERGDSATRAPSNAYASALQRDKAFMLYKPSQSEKTVPLIYGVGPKNSAPELISARHLYQDSESRDSAPADQRSRVGLSPSPVSAHTHRFKLPQTGADTTSSETKEGFDHAPHNNKKVFDQRIASRFSGAKGSAIQPAKSSSVSHRQTA